MKFLKEEREFLQGFVPVKEVEVRRETEHCVEIDGEWLKKNDGYTRYSKIEYVGDK